MRDPEHVPVEGKFPNQWTWWDDPDIIKQGQVVFEGKDPVKLPVPLEIVLSVHNPRVKELAS